MRKREIGLWQLGAILGLLALFLYFGEKQGWLAQVRGEVERGVIWMRKKIYKVKRSSQSNQSNQRDRARIISLEEKVWELEAENRDLRRQLGAPLPAQMRFVPAEVIGPIGESGQGGEILIEVGEREGVGVGAAVVLENILLGRVSSVTPRLSRVRLLSAPNNKVMVKTEGGARGIVTGSKGQGSNSESSDSVFLERVLQSESLKMGEKVLTTGEDGLPPNLLVGEVMRIFSEEREPFKKAEIKLFVDVGEVERVFVVSNF